MTHQLYNSIKRASQLHNEHNDCAVRAIALSTGLPYEVAHKALADQGRQNRRGTYRNQQSGALGALGFEIEVHRNMRQPSGSRYTPKTIHKYCEKGSWMVFVNRHVLAVVDGNVLDWTDGRKHRVQEAWKIIGDEEMNKLTTEYNELARELGLPELKARLRKNSEGTPEERVQKLRDAVAKKREAEKPKVKPIANGIKPVRIGTALHTLIELTIDNPGFTRDQLCSLMEEHGFVWQSSSVAVNMSYQIPRKGYEVRKEGKGAAARYWITNANRVV